MRSFTRRAAALAAIGALYGMMPGIAAADPLSIDKAEWKSDDRRLRVEGKGTDGRIVVIRNAGNGVALAMDTVDDEKWQRRIGNLTEVPCRVRVEQSNGEVRERDVKDRPSGCAPAIPSLRISDASVAEGGTANFTLSLSAPSTQPVTVVAGTSNGSATAGSDYTARSNVTVTIPAGATTQTFAVTTLRDTATEGNETFNVNLGNPLGATIADARGVGTITNAGSVTPALSVNDVTVNEGGTASFTVSLSAASTQTVTVLAGTANGTATAGSDYTARGNVTLTFPAGTITQTFAVATLSDAAAEGNETFSVNLTNPTNATLADAQGVGTISNVAPALPTLSVNDVTVAEGGTANFTVTLSAPSTQQVTVLASTANVSAAAGSDYTARTGVTLTFAAGTTTQSFAVATLADGANEGSETFSVNLTSPTNATLADAQGVGTISNVAPALPTLSVNDVTVTEGNTATFTVTLSASSASQVTVVFSTANGTAAAPGDYTAVANRTLTIPAGQTSVTTQVVTAQDSVAETTETFNVTLSGAVGATITDGSGVGTITDNDFTSAAQAHATMTTYDGPQTCIGCHETQARQMHGSVHYQQNGPATFTTNIAAGRLAGEGPAGKPSGVTAAVGINTYCGTHENSPRFTCAGCHVGNGRFPKTPAELTALSPAGQLQELANIDCLTCHQQAYKRFPDWTSAGAGFSDLTLLNVTLDASGALAPRVCLPGEPPEVCTVKRSGLSGIPNVDAATLDFMFRPSGAAGSLIPLPAGAPLGPMTLTTEQAAQQVHATTRQSCLNCHAGAAGANGAKRGDLSTANIASSDNTLDRHMSTGTGGSNLTCSSCHNVNDTAGNSVHRVRGRGLDLRANDVPQRFTCDSAGCHTGTPHASTHSAVLNRHASRVACQTCHIPRFGKGVATEIARDWQKPHVTQTACNGRGGWLPEETKSSTATPPVGAIPSYAWFDGTSQVYYLTEPLGPTTVRPNGVPTRPLPANIASLFGMAAGTPAYVMGQPNGGIAVDSDPATRAKIYPMKEHWGKLARNTADNTLIPHSTFEFFRTGSFCRAVAVGLGQNPDTACGTGQDAGVPAGAEVVPVHTYQTINHGVESRATALGAGSQCGNCHATSSTTALPGGPARMDLKGQLGYGLRTGASAVSGSLVTGTLNADLNRICAQCHGNQTSANERSFTQVHNRHVTNRQKDCAACHNFTRIGERTGLNLNR
jgi:hypothetical protein